MLPLVSRSDENGDHFEHGPGVGFRFASSFIVESVDLVESAFDSCRRKTGVWAWKLKPSESRKSTMPWASGLIVSTEIEATALSRRRPATTATAAPQLCRPDFPPFSGLC